TAPHGPAPRRSASLCTAPQRSAPPHPALLRSAARRIAPPRIASPRAAPPRTATPRPGRKDNVPMRIARVTIDGVAPYSQSPPHPDPKLDPQESPDAYELRTWRSKLHTSDAGTVVVPAFALK